MSARFRIKRQRPYNAADRYPWKVKDAQRPAFLGHYPSLERALLAVDNQVRTESGLPTRLPAPSWRPDAVDEVVRERIGGAR